MKKLIFLLCFSLVLLSLHGQESVEPVEPTDPVEDPCNVINFCAAAGSRLLLPGWPLPVTACPFEGGSSLCCTTCTVE